MCEVTRKVTPQEVAPHARLFDAITDSADRATSVLIMLSGQYIGTDTGTWSDKITFGVIESAIREIEDMKAIVEGYCDAVTPDTNTNKGGAEWAKPHNQSNHKNPLFI